MKEYNIAIYIRLSMADEEIGSSKAESDSIVNQRSLISRYLDRHPALSRYKRTEFCDDGYTGTNTNRPAFTDMMKRIKDGEFNLICVKDFSRFSRDYIEIGDCLECLFPFLGVRFISINDNYDSDDYKGTTGGLDVVMRNIVYAAYSKDLSVKTTTAKIQLMKQGKFVGGYATYGYVLHPTIRNKLAVDPDAAEVVRHIFDLATQGFKPTEIAIKLNQEDILTPGQYFISKHPDTNKYRHTSDKLSWSHSMVYKVLTNLVYTGTTVGYKAKIVAPLSRKVKKQEDKDRYIVEGTHEAIVSREIFDKAQECIKRTNRKPAVKAEYSLRSLIRCGNCGRSMLFNRNKTGFYCTYGRTDPDSGCPSKPILAVEALEKCIYDAIMLYLSASGTKGKTSNELLKMKKNELEKCVESITDIQKQRDKLKKQKLHDYERYTAGTMSKQAYLDNKRNIDEKLSALKQQISDAEQRMRKLEEIDEQSEAISPETAAFVNEPKLTYEMAHAFVDMVYVYPDGTNEIRWKFKDFMQDV